MLDLIHMINSKRSRHKMPWFHKINIFFARCGCVQSNFIRYWFTRPRFYNDCINFDCQRTKQFYKYINLRRIKIINLLNFILFNIFNKESRFVAILDQVISLDKSVIGSVNNKQYYVIGRMKIIRNSSENQICKVYKQFKKYI